MSLISTIGTTTLAIPADHTLSQKEYCKLVLEKSLEWMADFQAKQAHLQQLLTTTQQNIAYYEKVALDVEETRAGAARAQAEHQQALAVAAEAAKQHQEVQAALEAQQKQLLQQQHLQDLQQDKKEDFRIKELPTDILSTPQQVLYPYSTYAPLSSGYITPSYGSPSVSGYGSSSASSYIASSESSAFYSVQ
eukprot:gnl/Hemi2/14195_TR4815_c0_g1_i2.p1 gnl/Hemi2/14195_TR4815_c0_g1~~gnl/Hemi2/14195_TR4815_c0_g1_i2.p1  ORF type:complete len:192 (-),score=99.22 gnl/Hemi2/14195_TR4815_c0_g1_i2:170-745(-)